jgi:CHAD domain-containing protein
MASATRVFEAAEGVPLGLEPVVQALSSKYVVARGASQRVRRRRLDTFDHRLRDSGLTLEHQIAAARERLVLGRVDGSATVTVPVRDARWPALADGLPPGPVRDTVAPVAGIRALMVASDERRRIQPLALRNAEGKTVVRLELDEPGAVVATPARLIVCALRGYVAQARRAERLLVGLGLHPVDNGGEGGSGSVVKAPPEDRAIPARVVLAAVLSGFLVTMRENVPGLLDDVDTEFLHDFRVSVRRTRATLKLGRPVLPAAMRTRWEPDFRWLGDLTTPTRDLDVYELGLPAMSGWLVSADPGDLDPLARHLHGRRTVERRTLVRALRSARFRRLITEWDDELARLGVPSDAPDDAVGELLSAGRLADRSVSRAYKRVGRDGALIRPDSPATELHGLRKRCKELRYALEVFAPLIDRAAGKRAVADLKGLQDVLGRFQDAEVQRRALRGFAEEMMAEGTSAGAMLAMGELIGHLDAEQDRARQEFDVTFARFERPASLTRKYRTGGRT